MQICCLLLWFLIIYLCIYISINLQNYFLYVIHLLKYHSIVWTFIFVFFFVSYMALNKKESFILINFMIFFLSRYCFFAFFSILFHFLYPLSALSIFLSGMSTFFLYYFSSVLPFCHIFGLVGRSKKNL